MAVQSADIEYRFTAPGAGSGDSQSGTAATSLGEYVSTTQMVSGTLHNLFDVVTGAENAALDIEYRCFAVCNTNGVDTWTDVTMWIASAVAGGADMAVGLDPAGVVDVDSGSAQGAVIATEGDAPAGVSFTTPTPGSPLAVGSLGPGQCRLIWVRRTATDSPSVTNDGGTLTFSGTV